LPPEVAKQVLDPLRGLVVIASFNGSPSGGFTSVGLALKRLTRRAGT